MKVMFCVDTGFVGSSKEYLQEYDKEEIEGLSDQEVQEMIEEDYMMWLWDNINSNWWVVDE